MDVEHCNNVEDLRLLGESWLKGLHNEAFGLTVDLDVVKADLEMWLAAAPGCILVAKINGEPVAMFAVFVAPSYMGRQNIAIEKYWYAKPGAHFAGPRLYVEAVQWAKTMGCSHLVTSASKMASDRHDSICRFLEKTGAQHFETSYIQNLMEVTF